MSNLTRVERSNRDGLTSLVVAIAFLFNGICMLANILFPQIADFGDGFVVVMLLAGIAAMFTKSSIRMNGYVLATNTLVLILMIVSYVGYNLNSDIASLIMNYLAWGFGVVIIMMQGYDIEKVINYAFAISVVIILADLITGAHNNYESMTWTYSIFPCIATSIIHFLYCRFDKGLYKLLYIPGIISVFKFVENSNRGGLLSLATIIIFMISRPNKKTKVKYQNRRIITTALLIVLIIFVAFFEPIVVSTYNLLDKAGIEISAVSKTYRLIETNNLVNNREELYRFAWDGFLSSPIVGHGIGGFSVNHGGWAHNLILQLLYEGGIILFTIIMIPLIKNCLFVMRSGKLTEFEYSFFVLLFSTSIPKLLFSTELWKTQTFWMLGAFCVIAKLKYSSGGRMP